MKYTGRILLVLLVLVVSTMLFYPTIKWYLFTPEADKELALTQNIQIKEYSLGQASRDVRMLRALVADDRNAGLPEEYAYLEKVSGVKGSAYQVLSAFKSEQDLLDVVEAHYRDHLLDVKKLSTKVLQLGLDLRGGMSVLLEADLDAYAAKHDEIPSSGELTALLNEDISILTARIDQFGVTEPDIRLQGDSQILIEIPGEADPERVNSFLQGKGSLTFHLVDSSMTGRVKEYFSLHPSLAFNDDGTLNPPDFIPDDRSLVGYYEEDEYGLDTLKDFVVIHNDVVLDGIHLVSANTSTDAQTNRPVVDFRLDAEGGDIFYSFTSSHVGEPLAVVMDGRAKSVATINSAISDSVQLSGGFTREEAENLAVILKTASLPLELEVVSQQAVGASLGDDAVHIALKAIIVGLVLVLVFMVAYYGPAGFVADVALLMNFYMMISVLSAMSFTLTLTSIAGLVLTLGMAIDANVIIYERMKDELKEHKTAYEAVSLGFGRAFWTIMDSNVTTIIAAIILSILGSSSVKGFANTLAIGIACSLFTSLFVSHLIFDLFVRNEDSKGIRLGWRRKK